MLLLLALMVVQLFRPSISTSHGVYRLKETHNVPAGWRKVGPAPAALTLDLHISLKQEGLDELQRHVYEVSDPMHARYGQYLRLDEVNELSKPSNEAVSLVHEWLLDNGIDDFGSNSARNRINFRIRVDEAAQLLDTTYYIFEHEDGSRLVRTTEWSLPSELHDIINVVQPTTSFMRALPPNNKRSSQPSKRAISNRVVSEDCDTKLTIGCIKDLYGISGYSQTALDNNKIGFVNFIEYSPVVEDIVQYLQNNKEANPAAVDPSTGWSSFSDYVTISQGPGPEHTYTPDAPHDEATADADLILGLTYPMPMRTWSTGGKANSSQFQPDAEYPEVGTNQNEPWSTWLAHIWKEQDLPHVISVSYSDPEDTIPKTMAHEICTDFMTLGGFGVTILASSGNDGLGPSDFCHGSTPKPGTPMFIPHFPASCPWVTTVGATMLVDSKEVAANPAVDIFAPRSGFGFSNYFDRPWWQEDAVGKYLKPLTGDADKYKGWWNPGGRAYPDVSATGSNLPIVTNKSADMFYGTSVATPIVASIFALLKDAIITQDKNRRLGFLNPWIYSNLSTGFNDVATPLSTKADQGCDVKGPFFPVQTGWDVVTGWGSPNFGKLKKLLLS